MFDLAAPDAGFVLIDPATLDEMASQGATATTPADEVATFDRTLAYYDQEVRQQMLHRACAPAIPGLGEHAPLIGHHVDYPMY